MPYDIHKSRLTELDDAYVKALRRHWDSALMFENVQTPDLYLKQTFTNLLGTYYFYELQSKLLLAHPLGIRIGIPDFIKEGKVLCFSLEECVSVFGIELSELIELIGNIWQASIDAFVKSGTYAREAGMVIPLSLK